VVGASTQHTHAECLSTFLASSVSSKRSADVALSSGLESVLVAKGRKKADHNSFLVSGAAGLLTGGLSGGKALGGAALGGGKALGGAALGGGKALGGVALSGGKALGGAALSGGKAVGGVALSGAKFVGGAALSGTKAVGGAVGKGVKAVGKGVGKLFGFGGDDKKAEAAAQTAQAAPAEAQAAAPPEETQVEEQPPEKPVLPPEPNLPDPDAPDDMGDPPAEKRELTELSKALTAEFPPKDDDFKPTVDNIVTKGGSEELGSQVGNFSRALKELKNDFYSNLSDDRIAGMTAEDVPNMITPVALSLREVLNNAHSLSQRLMAMSEASYDLIHKPPDDPDLQLDGHSGLEAATEQAQALQEAQSPAEAGAPEDAQSPAEAGAPEDAQSPAEAAAPADAQNPVEAQQLASCMPFPPVAVALRPHRRADFL